MYIVHIKKLLIFLCVLALLPMAETSAQPIPPSAAQEGGAVLKQKPFEGFKRETTPQIEEKEKEVTPPPSEAAKKFLIEHINVEGNTVISDDDIMEITSEYEYRELSLADLMEAAKKIADLYASKGYITSQAYVPPQTIKNNTVTIKILEGKFGNFNVEGVQNSNEAIIKRRLKKKTKKPLNYNDLRDDLLYLNQNPDRIARAVLYRGSLPGTTDVLIKVKDRPPVHPFITYDNTGNKTTGNRRLTLGLEDNSLLGWEDRASVRFMRSDTFNFYGLIGDYIIPVNESGTKLGVSAAYFKSKIGGDFQDFNIRSWSGTISPFIIHPVFDLAYKSGTLAGTIDGGLDIKEARTKIQGSLDSRDKLRIMKGAVTLDESDSVGRTQFRSELNLSFANFLGSMREHGGSPSRDGGSANFVRYNYSLSRINAMPFSTYLLLSAAGQASNSRMLNSEQYRIGGMYTVRGYDEGHALGDYGSNAGAELRYPFYFIPDGLSICGIHPRRALQGAIFVDWGFSHFRSPSPASTHNSNLLGAGFGGRLNIMNCFSGRYDIAWPLADSSSYGRAPKAHMYFSFEEPSMQEWEQVLDEMMYTRIEDKLAEAKKEVPAEMTEDFEKAKSLEKEGRYEEAKELYAKVVEIRDQVVTGAQIEIQDAIKKEQEAHMAFEQAQKFSKEGNLEKAKEEYNKVLELAWNHATPKEEKAIKAFEEAEKYDQKGDVKKAKLKYKKALELAK